MSSMARAGAAGPELQFLGAARTVTGSKFLLTAGGRRLLIDCGLFQGLKELRERNWADLPVPASSIDAVILTHAHLDHSGYLPRLARQGFDGPAYCAPATADLLALLLPDSGHLQEEEARYANKYGYSKHHPALPLYTRSEAERSLGLLRAKPYGKPFEPVPGVRAVLHPSGHILGAAFVELEAGGRRLVVSGDLGGYGNEVMRGPAPIPPETDYVLVETTYGGRRQDHRPVEEQLREHIAPVLENSGVVVIPAFAVGRTTLVLYHLRRLQDAGGIPQVPVFVDSPMATDAVDVHCRHPDEHNLRVDVLKDPERCLLRPRGTRLVRDVEDSKRLNDLAGPAIIVSASGMATGGRVLHHLKRRLPGKGNLVLLVGFQAQGTRGRSLLEGAKKVRMLGEEVPVRARVAAINGFSAHGDADDLLRWLKTARPAPKKIFLVHGEPEGIADVSRRVAEELKFPCHAPAYLEKIAL